eukprot:2478391-Pleurochrysis_carterae.AAC.2
MLEMEESHRYKCNNILAAICINMATRLWIAYLVAAQPCGSQCAGRLAAASTPEKRRNTRHNVEPPPASKRLDEDAGSIKKYR